jgi:hypothetical protein
MQTSGTSVGFDRRAAQDDGKSNSTVDKLVVSNLVIYAWSAKR